MSYAPNRSKKVGKAPEWTKMTDLASGIFGGRVLFATDEWFAAAARLLLEAEPVFNQEYTEYGKWMDGWETRRKRIPGHDWCIVRLGFPGRVSGITVDTAFFTGNQAPRFSLQGIWMPHEPEALTVLGKAWETERVGSAATEEEIGIASKLGSEEWHDLIGMTPLRPGYENERQHYFAIDKNQRYTHLRLNIFPDGGIARLRVHGAVERSWAGVPLDEEIDLLSVENGGSEVGCSNHHYGQPKNMIKSGRGLNMGDGWETARKPDRPAILELGSNGLVKAPGSDWAVLKLGLAGEITRLVVDTDHFKGNFPESVSVDACFAPEAQTHDFLDGVGGSGMAWRPLLLRQKTGPSREHIFELSKGKIEKLGPVSHVKLSIMPDGGVMRLRCFGLRAATAQGQDLSRA